MSRVLGMAGWPKGGRSTLRAISLFCKEAVSAEGVAIIVTSLD